MKIGLIIFTILFLHSCGGGTPSVDSNSADVAGSAVNSSKFNELTVSSDFDFIGGENLTIEVVNVTQSLERRYINICSEFSKVGGQYKINYNSCLLRTSLQSDYREFKVVLSSNEQELLAQVWPMVDGASPKNYHWNRSEGVNDWKIEVL
ncbi:MAG: hypothetical protein GY820_23220 [Gammaproteobacteria bacterium]|nr:hypothetical protein [Gammaproteobacteria bacterium]